MDLKQISKHIYSILKRKRDGNGITFDEQGWANVDELIAAVRKKYPKFSKPHLMFIVHTDEKQRYSFGNALKKIRVVD